MTELTFTSDSNPMDWETAFSEAMRQRGANGREIGEALATVREHCRDANTLPHSAFGPAARYAEDLRPDPLTIREHVRLLLPTMTTVGAYFMVMLMPKSPLTSPVTVNWPSVGMVVVFVAFALLAQRVEPRRWVLTLALADFLLLMALIFAPTAWLVPVATVPAWSLWLVATSLTILGLVLGLRLVLDRPKDPVTGRPIRQTTFWMTPWVPLLFSLLALLGIAMRIFDH